MIIVAIVMLLGVVTFALQNAQMVDIVFLAWSFRLNLALVVVGSLSLGVITGFVWQWISSMAVRNSLKEMQKRLDSEQNKVTTLERAVQELTGRSQGEGVQMSGRSDA